MVTFDEVFALAVEIGTPAGLLPRPEDDLDFTYRKLLNSRDALLEYRAAAPKFFEDLAAVGVRVRNLTEVLYRGEAQAVPVILEWLPKVGSGLLKRDMVIVLGGSAYVEQNKQALVDEFRRIDPDDDPGDNSIRYIISDVLSRGAKASDVDLLMNLASDPRNGSARLSPARALGRFKTQRAKTVPLLLELLDDDRNKVWAYAAIALGLLRVPEARPRIAERLKAEDNPDWIIDLKKALKRIDEATTD